MMYSDAIWAPPAAGPYAQNPSNITPTKSPGSTSGSNVDMASLTNLINSLNQGNQQTANAGRIAGATGLQDQSTANISSALGGQVPLDVINQLSQQSAERGVMTGAPAGASTNANYLRSLGLTSLGMMGQGEQWLSGALARNPAAPVENASDVWKMQQQLALQRDQLAQQKYIAEMNAQTDRMLRSRSGGGAGTETTPAITMPSIPQFSTTQTGGGAATQTGSTTTNENDAMMWDYFPELMYQGDWGDLNAFSQPSGTYYNPSTDTSNYDFGLGSWDLGAPASNDTASWDPYNWNG